LKPGTQPVSMESLAQRRRFRRKVQGIAAALLPYESDGKVAVEAFQQHLVATHRAGLDIPEIKGIKHSSLDRLLELERIALRDSHRPDFRIYTGNDLGIDMIEYGSDYLLGLATFAPEKFAERDRLWENGDPDYYAISDALQYLGDVAFREPVPAYKHSAAVFLHLVGRIPSDLTHPKNPKRPSWEWQILHDCARRLGYE